MSYYRSISCHGRTIRQKKLFIYNEQLCIKINNCQVAVTNPPTTFQQRSDNLWRKPKTNNFCRNSGDDCIIWDIFGDNGTGSDNCSVADFYTAAKFYVTADPNIIAESYRFYLFKICRGGFTSLVV